MDLESQKFLIEKAKEYLEAAENVAPDVWNALVQWEIAYGIIGLCWTVMFLLGAFWFLRRYSKDDNSQDPSISDYWIFLLFGGVCLIVAGACLSYAVPRLVAPEVAALRNLMG